MSTEAEQGLLRSGLVELPCFFNARVHGQPIVKESARCQMSDVAWIMQTDWAPMAWWLVIRLETFLHEESEEVRWSQLA